jgi:hypothetical protein
MFRWEGDNVEAALERAARERPALRDWAVERTDDAADCSPRLLEDRGQTTHKLPVGHPA